MKKLVLILTVMIVLASCVTVDDADTVLEYISWDTVDLLSSYEGYSLAVYDFISEYEEDEELVNYIRQTLTTEIANAAMYDEVDISVLGRQNMDELMEEQAFQMSELADEESQVEFGRILGADLIMTGTLTWMDEDYCSINAQIIEVESGIVLGGFTESIYFGE